MKTITLEVSEPTAEKIAKMTPTEKELIAKSLDRFVSNRRNFSDIIHEVSEQARKNGLTAEILEDLLKDE
jgi:DNA replication initiation complex subunit (GINS family)